MATRNANGAVDLLSTLKRCAATAKWAHDCGAVPRRATLTTFLLGFLVAVNSQPLAAAAITCTQDAASGVVSCERAAGNVGTDVTIVFLDPRGCCTATVQEVVGSNQVVLDITSTGCDSLAVGQTLDALVADAEPASLDFSLMAPQAGVLKYYLAKGPLSGTGLRVSSVIGLGTPANDSVEAECLDCRLDFTTGNLQTTGRTQWLFQPGGMITLTGGLAQNGVLLVPRGSTLLNGTFTDRTVVMSLPRNFKILGGSFADVKHGALSDFYGLPTTDPGCGFLGSGRLNMSFNTPKSPPSTFVTGLLYSGDVFNCLLNCAP